MNTDSVSLQPGQSIKPAVSLEQAKKIVLEQFGLQVGKIKELNSYDDRNFYVEIEGRNDPQKKFILKVLNSMDTRKTGHVEVEHAIMFHLSGKGVKCPIPQKTLTGSTFAVISIPDEDVQNDNKPHENPSPQHLIRLLSFVEGSILFDVPIDSKLLLKTGAYIAQIENQLKECSFPVLETFTSIWKLGQVMDLGKFLYVIQDKHDRFKLVKSVLTSYKDRVEPILHTFETGIVHGDYNEQNILVQKSTSEPNDYEVSGIIDFGDLHVAPYVFELAITICYMMMESMRCGIVDPFETVGHVVAGYSSIRKVPEVEFQLMRTLVASRLCQSLVMGAYSYSQDPGNEYILVTAKRGWVLLELLWNEKTDNDMINACIQFLK